MSEKVQEELIDEMFSAGVHYGYSRSKRHPSMKKAIYGVKSNMEIIDLEKTVQALATAEEFVTGLAKEGKKILFVGSKNQIRDVTETQAQRIDMPFVKNRWIGGTLTNFSEIKKRILRLKDLTEKKEKGELSMYTKKERLMIDREIEKLEKNFGGVVSITDVFPAAMFVVDSKSEEIAVNEAVSVGIPVIAITNSDCDISNVTYPIPANDSVRASVEFLTRHIVDAYKKGQVKK
ncbi:MAG: 30S ribosomal protein S2 [Candidatus Aenigmarchaeota archaeon]|nr:30S ribosomal protein S2 [Candidatus Aenigmarchaeota archaeon]